MAMNFGNMLDDATENAGDAASFDRFDPPDGEVYEVEVIRTNSGLTKNKNGTKFGLFLKVTNDCDDKGRAFWDNVYLVEGNSYGNSLGFAKLAVAGASPDFMKTNPEAKAVAEIMVGSTFRVQTGTQKDSDFRDHKYKAAEGTTFEKSTADPEPEPEATPAATPAEGDSGGIPWDD